MKNVYLSILEHLQDYYYIIVSFLSGLVYVIWKGIKKWKDALGTIVVAVILGMLTFEGITGVEATLGEPTTWYLAVLYNAKGSIVALVSLSSEMLYKGIITLIAALPKIIMNKFNFANDCKIENDEGKQRDK